MNMLITSKVNVWLCDVVGGRLQSMDAAAERGRLVRAVMYRVGG